jgi:hypothetical protein
MRKKEVEPLARTWSVPALVALAALAGATPSAGAVTYYLAADAPARLGGVDYRPGQILRSDDAAYVLEAALPADAAISALHRRADGVWLVAPGHALGLGGSDIEPRDVIAFDGVSFAIALDGSAAGIPESARIDALFLEAAGRMVLSFDAPVRLGGADYGPSDLVRYDASFAIYREAAAAGVPAYANIVGAALDNAGTLVVSFDVPTRVGAVDYRPGDLVSWSGAGFSLYFSDPAWPPQAQLRDFSFVPGAGSVPGDGGGVPLRISLEITGEVTLSWGASCVGGDSDFAVYEGAVPDFASHAPKLCSTGGTTSATLPPGAGGRYFLVVPRNAVREGSYGQTSLGAERPPLTSACLPQELAACP